MQTLIRATQTPYDR